MCTGLENGAVVEAANAVQAARFRGAPTFQHQLEDQAAHLAAERQRLEAELAQHAPNANATSAPRGANWPHPSPAATIPFADDQALIPLRKPCDAHVGLAAYVEQPSWPSWFTQAVTQARRQFSPASEEIRA
jgi:hypothetical protein